MRRAPPPGCRSKAMLIGFVATLLAPPAAVLASDPPAPRGEAAELAAARHFEAALAHADRQEFELAVVEFEQANTLAPHPIVSYNLGLSHAALGRSALALAAFERSLAEGGAALGTERIARIRELCEAQKAKLGRLELDVSPREARIGIDAVMSPRVTSPVWLDPGVHRVTVSAPGHQPFAGEVTLRARETTRLEVRLSPLSPPPPAPPESAALSQQTAAPPPAVHHDSGDDARFWAYVAGGSGLGLGGAAIMSHVLANARYGQWEDVRDVVAREPNSSARDRNQATLAELKSEVKTFDAFTVAFGIGAGALLAGGAYLYLSAPSEPRNDAASIGLSGSTLLLRGRF